MRFFAFAFALSGCALVSGLSDVKVKGTSDASIPEATMSAGCPLSCGSTVPDGWTPVVRLKDSTGTCGARTTVNFATGAVDAASACPCTCSVATMPSCIGGDHPVKFGDQCSIAGSFIADKCTGPQTTTIAGAYALTAIPPTGGTCSAPSTAPNLSAKLTVRACSMPQGCSGAPCAGADEVACIDRLGSVACPTDYPISSAIFANVSVSCTCSGSCSLQASCTSPALHFYSDNACTNEVSQAPATGTCNANAGAGKQLGSYQYMATVNALCSGSGAGSPKVDPVTAMTLCCKP